VISYRLSVLIIVSSLKYRWRRKTGPYELEEKEKMKVLTGHVLRHSSHGRGAMQLVRQLDPQSICEKLLTLDSKILYSSYLDSAGSIVGEATKSLIGFYDELTVMVLPLHPGKGALVLAAPIGSDLTEIVTKAKSLHC
jgi:hypothetical protein